MTIGKPSGLLLAPAAILVSILVFCHTSTAQGPVPDAPMPVPAVERASTFVSVPPTAAGRHTFWDRENKILFTTAAAFSYADFAVTRSNLQSGGRELNPMVRIFGRSSAGLALNFAGENVGILGVSYFFHKTGHHKLERLVPVVNIAASAGAVSYGVASR